MIIFGRGGKLRKSKEKSGKSKNPQKVEKPPKHKGWAHSILKLGLRAILRGLWATRRVSEALQALSMALWASRCQKMMTFGSEPKKNRKTLENSTKKNLQKDVLGLVFDESARFGGSLGGQEL